MTKTLRNISQLIHLPRCKLLEHTNTSLRSHRRLSENPGLWDTTGWGPAACDGQAGHSPAPQPARAAGSGQAPAAMSRPRTCLVSQKRPRYGEPSFSPARAQTLPFLVSPFRAARTAATASPAPHTNPHCSRRHSAIFTEGKRTPAEVIGQRQP
ncbi:unnamed protein product [Coccothraustes coccothraustes]